MKEKTQKNELENKERPPEWKKYGIFKGTKYYYTTLEDGVYRHNSAQEIIDKYKNGR